MSNVKERTVCLLKQIWADLFDEKCFTINYPDDSCQGLLMLLETALSRAKYVSSNHLNLKSTCEKHIAELDWKTKECNKLKAEVNRLEAAKCHKCSLLETELLHYKKKSFEAQNRIKSIANILRLGESIEELEGQRKNSAMTLVSQMLLEESPKRKKRLVSNNENTPVNENCDVVPETVPLMLNDSTLHPDLDSSDIITSPSKKDKTSRSVNLPVTSAKKSPKSIKKNLTADFVVEKFEKSPKKKKIGDQSYDQISLNGSLVDYVKDFNSELDKIWFGNSTDELKTKNNKIINDKIAANNQVLNETSHQKTKRNIWKMKEMRGPSEISGSKRLRQMKLNVCEKNVEVDLSTLNGYDGGNVEQEIPSVSRNIKDLKEMDSPFSEHFKPEACSTQKNEKVEKKTMSPPKKTGSPNYKYKREAVRKKAERMKLDGWDCVNCAEYYGAVGLSPSKIKSRLNKCSKHRDKFDQLNQTPADYWNPIFPDTQECREKKLYVSVYCPKDDSNI